MSENGDLWMWGNGSSGQLSEVSEGKDVHQPMKLPMPSFNSESPQGQSF